MRLLPLLAVLAVAACSDARSHRERPVPDEVRLIATVTPGKPGAPTEQVEVVRRGRESRLLVRRTGAEGNVLASAEAVLTQQEMTELWQVVESQKLEDFRPQEEPGEVSDFGERRLHLEWGPAASAQRLELVWQRPLANAGRLHPLLSRLATLAHRHAPGVPLFYLPNLPNEGG